MATIFLGCDHDLTATATDSAGTPLTAATVTWTLYNAAGTSLGTGTLAHTSGGVYTGVIESSTFSSQTAGALGQLRTTLVQGDYDDHRRERVVFQYRPLAG